MKIVCSGEVWFVIARICTVFGRLYIYTKKEANERTDEVYKAVDTADLAWSISFFHLLLNIYLYVCALELFSSFEMAIWRRVWICSSAYLPGVHSSR